MVNNPESENNPETKNSESDSDALSDFDVTITSSLPQETATAAQHQDKSQEESERITALTPPKFKMDQFLRPPPALSFDGNLKENWKRWKRSFEIYLGAVEMDAAGDARKVSLLLHCAGEDAVDKFEQFQFAKDEDRKKLEEVYKAFENYCTPKTNESVETQIFFSRLQKDGENFNDFYTDLRKLSGTCNFGDLRDRLVKDRIISGIREDRVKDRLLREENLSLEKCIRICKAAEVTEAHLKTMGEEKINALKSQHRKTNESDKKQSHFKNSKGSPQYSEQRKQPQSQQKHSASCTRCGRSHNYGREHCPAFGKVCHKCNKANHFDAMCKTKSVNMMYNDNNDNNHNSDTEAAESINSLFIS